MNDNVLRMQSRPSLKDMQKRVANPSFLPPVGPNPVGSPFDYGVSKNKENGNVCLHLGGVQPFEFPPETAIKLAMLLLKQAGVEVDIGNGQE